MAPLNSAGWEMTNWRRVMPFQGDQEALPIRVSKPPQRCLILEASQSRVQGLASQRLLKANVRGGSKQMAVSKSRHLR